MSKTRVNVLVETEAPAPSHSLSQPMALTDAVDDAMTMVEAGHDAGRYLPWLYKVHCKLLACPVKKVHHQEIIAKLEPFLLLHTDDEASRKWQRQALSTRQKEGK